MTTSGLVTVTACIVVAIYDMVAVRSGGVENSVSWFIRQTAVDHPTLILACGILIGHWFCAMEPQR